MWILQDKLFCPDLDSSDKYKSGLPLPGFVGIEILSRCTDSSKGQSIVTITYL